MLLLIHLDRSTVFIHVIFYFWLTMIIIIMVNDNKSSLILCFKCRLKVELFIYPLFIIIFTAVSAHTDAIRYNFINPLLIHKGIIPVCLPFPILLYLFYFIFNFYIIHIYGCQKPAAVTFIFYHRLNDSCASSINNWLISKLNTGPLVAWFGSCHWIMSWKYQS